MKIALFYEVTETRFYTSDKIREILLPSEGATSVLCYLIFFRFLCESQLSIVPENLHRKISADSISVDLKEGLVTVWHALCKFFEPRVLELTPSHFYVDSGSFASCTCVASPQFKQQRPCNTSLVKGPFSLRSTPSEEALRQTHPFDDGITCHHMFFIAIESFCFVWTSLEGIHYLLDFAQPF